VDIDKGFSRPIEIALYIWGNSEERERAFAFADAIRKKTG
jgi:hypothetical protein